MSVLDLLLGRFIAHFFAVESQVVDVAEQQANNASGDQQNSCDIVGVEYTQNRPNHTNEEDA